METRSKMTLSTKVTDKEKMDFEDFCQKNGMKQSEMLRLLVSKVCPQIQAGERPEKNVKQLDKKMTLRWHTRDWDSLAVVAKKEGISKQQWIRKKIRASLHKAAPASEKELRELAASNREINAIGRNLNQIARRLNESEEADNQLTLDYIQNFTKYIEAHTDKVGRLVRVAYGRYGEVFDD